MSSLGVLENGLNTKRTAVKLHGFALLMLSFQTLGALASPRNYEFR